MTIRALLFAFLGCVLLTLGAHAAIPAAAREALEQENYDLAWQLAKKETTEQPNDLEGWIVLGHALSGQLEQAPFFKKATLARETRDAYQHAIEISPQNIEAHVSLFEYYRQAPSMIGGGRKPALEELSKIEQLDRGAAYPCKIRLALDDGKNAAALDLCEELFRLEPQSFRACYWLGATLGASGKQLPRAKELLQKAVTLTPRGEDPGVDDAYVALGAALEAGAEKESAAKAYAQAIKINPHNETARAKVGVR